MQDGPRPPPRPVGVRLSHRAVPSSCSISQRLLRRKRFEVVPQVTARWQSRRSANPRSWAPAPLRSEHAGGRWTLPIPYQADDPAEQQVHDGFFARWQARSVASLKDKPRASGVLGPAAGKLRTSASGAPGRLR